MICSTLRGRSLLLQGLAGFGDISAARGGLRPQAGGIGQAEDRPVTGLQYLAALIEKEPTDQAGGSDESYELATPLLPDWRHRRHTGRQTMGRPLWPARPCSRERRADPKFSRPTKRGR